MRSAQVSTADCRLMGRRRFITNQSSAAETLPLHRFGLAACKYRANRVLLGSIKELHWFPGIADHHHRVVPHRVSIMQLLTELSGGNTKTSLIEEVKSGPQIVKPTLVHLTSLYHLKSNSDAVLILKKFTPPTVVSPILEQIHNTIAETLLFLSRKL